MPLYLECCFPCGQALMFAKKLDVDLSVRQTHMATYTEDGRPIIFPGNLVSGVIEFCVTSGREIYLPQDDLVCIILSSPY